MLERAQDDRIQITRDNARLIALHRRRPFPLVNFNLETEPYLASFAALCRILQIPFREEAARDFYGHDLIVHEHDDDVRAYGEEIREQYEYLLAHQIQVS